MRNDARRMPFGAHRVAATENVDEARAALESVFLPMRIRPPEADPPPRRVDMALNALRVGELTASCLRFGRDVHIDIAEVENYHINVPLCGVAESRTGMQHVLATPERAAVFLPGLPAEINWHSGCTQLCLMFPLHTVQLELEAMLDRPVPCPIEFAPAMNLTTEHGRAWIAALHLLERQSDCQNGVLEHPLAAANLEKLLIHELLLGQPHTYTDALTKPRAPTPPRAVQQAIDLMHNHPEQPWTTASLARGVTVSARSLQEGFQRSAGVPPMRYLREVRLNRVHDDLQAATPDAVNVSQVARRWGFLYLGRFAADYRNKFGHTPSETLRIPRPAKGLDQVAIS